MNGLLYRQSLIKSKALRNNLHFNGLELSPCLLVNRPQSSPHFAAINLGS